jgi:hypothetical protein
MSTRIMVTSFLAVLSGQRAHRPADRDHVAGAAAQVAG